MLGITFSSADVGLARTTIGQVYRLEAVMTDDSYLVLRLDIDQSASALSLSLSLSLSGMVRPYRLDFQFTGSRGKT